jgi:ABC-type phosphate transport system permease subunit
MMTEKNTVVKSFRKVVLIIGTVLALFSLLAFVTKILINSSDKVHTTNPGREWEGQVMLAMFITYLVGYTFGWLWRLWGGIIIILASLVVSIPFVLDKNYASLYSGFRSLLLARFTLYYTDSKS